MLRIGLTGGIGSGKSTVAELLTVFGIPVYIADKESKRLTDHSPEIREQLTALFGEDLYTEHGLNRPLLASYIFANKEHLLSVNKIIHPVVLSDFLNWSEKQKSGIVMIESAILFESGFHQFVDKVVTVYAPEDVRIERISSRDNLTHEEIKKRMQSQLPEKTKLEQSDFIIRNDSECALIPQVSALVKEISC